MSNKGKRKQSKKNAPPVRSKWLNKYTIILTVFTVWVVFLDNNSMLRQQKVKVAINELKSQKEDYERKLADIKRQEEDLSKNIEKLAREKYNFGSPNEDVFIIESEPNK